MHAAQPFDVGERRVRRDCPGRPASLTRPAPAKEAFTRSRFLGSAGGRREIRIRLQRRRPNTTGLLI